MIRLYTFLIFSAIIVVLGYIFFILPRYDYVSQTKLLIVPQDIVIASNADHVMNNIVLIARSAVEENENVMKYGAHVELERITDHDVMTISVFSHNAKDGAILQKSALKNILQEIDAFYALSSDISIKTISQDNVPQKTYVAKYAPYVLMVSIAIGVISGVLAIFYLIDRMRDEKDYDDAIDGKKIFEKYNDVQKKHNVHTMQNDVQKKEEDDNDDIVAVIPSIELEEEDESVAEEVLEDIKKEDVETEEEIKEELQKEGVVPSGLPTTPGNLPVVDVDNLGFSQDKNDGVSEINDEKEPTEEELKARLNELLNGKL